MSALAVKTGKAQREQMFSALPPTTDIHQARTPCLKSAGAKRLERGNKVGKLKEQICLELSSTKATR
jgi:hypothetical protein